MIWEKSFVKRLAAICLSVAMTFAMGAPAFAVDKEVGLKKGISPLGKRVEDMLQSMSTTQTVVASEKKMVEQMLESGAITRADLNRELSALAAMTPEALRVKGYNNRQIAVISSYTSGEDAFTHAFSSNEAMQSSNSGAELTFQYGLSGTNSRKTVTIAYDMMWSECPFFTFTDSFGIGWIGADINSYELAMKTDSSMAEVQYYNPNTDEYAYLYRDVDMDTSGNGVVIGTPIIGSAQGNYGKHISGVTQVSTQSNSYNLETIHVFVSYAHTTVAFSFDWQIVLDWNKVSGAISFIPKPRHTIMVQDDHTFRYNSHSVITA